MKGRAKVLDSGFMEFVEYLQKIGELHNTLRMIDRLRERHSEDYKELDLEHHNQKIDHQKIERESGFNMLFSFWRKGWIEIREIDRRGKDWHRKEYTLLVRLEQIVEYCASKNDSYSKHDSYSKYSIPGWRVNGVDLPLQP